MSASTPPPASPSPTPQPLSADDERLWATLIHLGGIFFQFLPALIGYLVLKDRGPFVREHAKTALNFQLTVLAGYVVGFFTVWFLVGFLVFIIVGVGNVVFSIIAAVAANRGEWYRYPVAIPFISN
ncbi:MAG: uncharacterized protein QOI70_109 [Microbacteriaceae bacterium]|jgi:uncharacterized Tic20 family protein|nr:hypothetical protein [Microbacteriaceae bacterium]MDQ1596685.1 uncharacterized protein [Microbacteriaceae bacterium]